MKRLEGINSLSPLLSLSHSSSFITVFLTLVCLACTNSCHHPAGFECLRSTSRSLSLSSHPVVCLLHPFIHSVCFSSSLFRPLGLSCLIYIIPLHFFQPCALLILLQFPLCQLSFLDMFVICDGPLPSFHCCLFPLHTALFSAAVQIQARTGHN